MLSISSGDTTLTVDPDLGASIQSFSVDGRQVLRRGRPETGDPFEMASFPLVPWANRIADGTFVHRGVVVSPGGATVPGERHAIHGHGWKRRWDVREHSEDEIVLEFVHPAGAWPWRYRASQRMAVEPGRLTAELTITNRSDAAMPVALGFNPYFERPARLTAIVDGTWAGATVLPDHWEEHEGFRSADVDTFEVDATFTGWDGRALLDLEAGRFELTSDLPALHLYTPRGRHFFCAEPTASAPDALNHPERGGEDLDPDATARAVMRITSLG